MACVVPASRAITIHFRMSCLKSILFLFSVSIEWIKLHRGLNYSNSFNTGWWKQHPILKMYLLSNISSCAECWFVSTNYPILIYGAHWIVVNNVPTYCSPLLLLRIQSSGIYSAHFASMLFISFVLSVTCIQISKHLLSFSFVTISWLHFCS